MTDLERFMNEHREEFDLHEPPPGHFDRFEQRLANPEEEPRRLTTRPALLRIAAVILVLITVSVFAFDYAGRLIGEKFSSRTNAGDLPQEVREAVQYYNNQTATGLNTLKSLASTHESALALNESAIREIRSLDAATEDLKAQLAASPGNERIIEAIIQNQQMKESVVNNIIAQVSQTK